MQQNLAGGEQITQRSPSKTAGVGDVTIRNSVTLMRDNLDMREWRRPQRSKISKKMFFD